MALRLPLRPSSAMPRAYYLSQGYHAGHRALDMVGTLGQPVYAMESGRVFASSWEGDAWAFGGGNVVIIDHYGPGGRRLKSVYAHLKSRAVSKGQWVMRGRLIGYADSTGNSSGSHVHLGVGEAHGDPRLYASYQWLNPHRYMAAHAFQNGAVGNGDLRGSLYVHNTVLIKPGSNLRAAPSLSAGIKRSTRVAEAAAYYRSVSGSLWSGNRTWDHLVHPIAGEVYLHTLLGEWSL